jgi:hypothetical protein
LEKLRQTNASFLRAVFGHSVFGEMKHWACHFGHLVEILNPGVREIGLRFNCHHGLGKFTRSPSSPLLIYMRPIMKRKMDVHRLLRQGEILGSTL